MTVFRPRSEMIDYDLISLKLYYSNVTIVNCYKGVFNSRMFQGCFNDISRALGIVSSVFQGCFNLI